MVIMSSLLYVPPIVSALIWLSVLFAVRAVADAISPVQLRPTSETKDTFAVLAVTVRLLGSEETVAAV